MLITSKDNPRIKRIRRLASRKGRTESGLFFVAGSRLVAEAVQRGAQIVQLLLAPAADSACPELSRLCRAIPTLRVAPEVLAGLSLRGEPEEVGAVVRQRWERLERIRLRPEACWVAVSRIEHPGSIGTIMRICDAVRGEGVILLGDSADPYSPVAVRASTGAVFSQRVVRAGLGDLASWARRERCSIVGASPAASVDYRAASYRTPMVLMLGGERGGLTPGEEAACSLLVRIPMLGRCDSHHVAVAAGILLYEAFSRLHPPSR